VSVGYAALLTFFIASIAKTDWASGLGFVELIAGWLIFTALFAAMFASGIWRRMSLNKGHSTDIDPMTTLIVLSSAVVISVLAVAIAIVLAMGGFDRKAVLFGVLFLCFPMGFAALYYSRRGKPPVGGPD
jgi:hypothetical protein